MTVSADPYPSLIIELASRPNIPHIMPRWMAAVRIRTRFLRPQRHGKTLEAAPNSQSCHQTRVVLAEKVPTSR